jgi:hypothetical protein
MSSSRTTEPWEQLADGLHVLRDSCLVYAVQGPSGTVIVNAGRGWLPSI